MTIPPTVQKPTCIENGSKNITAKNMLLQPAVYSSLGLIIIINIICMLIKIIMQTCQKDVLFCNIC